MSLRDSLEDRFISGDVTDASSVPTIEWSTLGLGLLASFISAAALGLSETILSAGAWVSSSLRSLSAFVVGLGESAGSIIVAGVETSVESWEAFVGAFGPAAFPISVGVALGMIAAMWWVMRNVR